MDFINKLLVSIFFLYATNAFSAEFSCDSKLPSNIENSQFSDFFDVSKGKIHFDCVAKFYSEIKYYNEDACYFDEYIIRKQSNGVYAPIKLGQQWSMNKQCENWFETDFVDFEFYNFKFERAKKVHEFWHLFSSGKQDFLYQNINWFQRNFNEDLSAFFDSSNSVSDITEVMNLVTQDYWNNDIYTYTFAIDKETWQLNVDFSESFKIIVISKVVF